MKSTKLFGLIIITLIFASIAVAQEGQEIFVITVAESISTDTAEFVLDTISKANEESARCLIIQLNTPGGMHDAAKKIVKGIYTSDVPVVVYITPGKAKVESIGLMVAFSADIAAMAPNTRIGSAQPVSENKSPLSKEALVKVSSDLTSYLKGIALKRGRNEQWVDNAVKENDSMNEEEALRGNIIDIIAKDMDDLITQLDSREVIDREIIHLAGASTRFLTKDTRSEVVKAVHNPNIAYLLMMVGFAGLFFELAHPGSIFPGIIGGITLILAFFSFQNLPVNYAGFLLITFSIILFFMEMKITSYGLLTAAGIISLSMGSVMLFRDAPPELQLSWKVVVPTICGISLFFGTVAVLVLKAHLSQPKTGIKGLLGAEGVVRETLMPQGKVFVHGELWHAVSEFPIERDQKVRILNVENLLLKVAPVSSIDEKSSSDENIDGDENKMTAVINETTPAPEKETISEFSEDSEEKIQDSKRDDRDDDSEKNKTVAAVEKIKVETEKKLAEDDNGLVEEEDSVSNRDMVSGQDEKNDKDGADEASSEMLVSSRDDTPGDDEEKTEETKTTMSAEKNEDKASLSS